MRTLSLFALAISLPALAQVGNLQISTSSLNFAALSGASLPQSQVVGVYSTGVALPLNVSVRYLGATSGWLTATADAATTPSNVTVTVNPFNLSPGSYVGQVLIVASGTQSALVNVLFTVSASSSGSTLIASPTSVSLTSSASAIVQSTVAISSVSSTSFQVFTTTASGGNWLSVSTNFATSPASLTIFANPVSLAPGVYSGTVTVAPTSGSSVLAIPVTFNVSPGNSSGFSINPGTLSFNYQTGTATPASQSIFVNNSAGIVTYSAAASASWVKLTSNYNSALAQSVTGSTGTFLSVYVDPTSLTPGSYVAQISLTTTTGATQSLAVTLLVSNNAILSASPAAVAFNYTTSSGVPASQLLTITAAGSPVAFTASANSAGWLQVSPQSGTSNSLNQLTISISPGNLAAGTYSGSINIVSGATTLSVPVTLTVNISNFSAITASPSIITFQTQLNGQSQTQTLSLSAPAAKNFLVTASTSGGAWLQVSPGFGSAPAILTVAVLPQAVSVAGVYSGSIQIANLTDGTQLTVPVTMTVSGTTISASPQALSFDLISGVSTPVPQIVQLAGPFTTTFNVSSDSGWLTASPTSGTLPVGITVFANGANLSPGTYTGSLAITGGGASTTILVTATVAPNPAPTVTPTTLSFQFVTNGQPPPSQTINVGSTQGTAPFNTSVRTSVGSNWLTAVASRTFTPATITVSVQPAGLAPGTYRGVITVSGANTGESRSAEIVLTVSVPATPSLRTAAHSATRQLSAITPGMILSLLGSSMGPEPGVRGTVSGAGAIETSYNGYRVLFDGVAAPLLYISSTQIDTIAPYSIAGRSSARVEVEYNGVRSNPLDLFVSPDASPGIFTVDSSGRGQAAAINQNGTLNGPQNRAGADTILVFYATGEGQTDPVGQEGRIVTSDLRKPLLPVAVNIGGVPVEVLYAGSAPGQVIGLMQVNVRLNADVPRGPAVPIELRVGPAPSPDGVTIAIQ